MSGGLKSRVTLAIERLYQTKIALKNVKDIDIVFGKWTMSGHVHVYKFAREYGPPIRYHNPDVNLRVRRDDMGKHRIQIKFADGSVQKLPNGPDPEEILAALKAADARGVADPNAKSWYLKPSKKYPASLIASLLAQGITPTIAAAEEARKASAAQAEPQAPAQQ